MIEQGRYYCERACGYSDHAPKIEVTHEQYLVVADTPDLSWGIAQGIMGGPPD